MSDVRYACVYCYNSCHGNTAKQFPTVRDIVKGLYVSVMQLPW
jgi:hypothetical protein